MAWKFVPRSGVNGESPMIPNCTAFPVNTQTSDCLFKPQPAKNCGPGAPLPMMPVDSVLPEHETKLMLNRGGRKRHQN